jgi:hypothetical protein
MIKKYSFGIGDRFAHQGKYLLQAFVEAKALGLDISPVWSKSFREHKAVHTLQHSVRKEADQATKSLGWREPYFVDADHINASNVNAFIPYSDYFTIDVTNEIGIPLSLQEKSEFLKQYQEYIGLLTIPGLSEALIITTDQLLGIADKFHKATLAAAQVYQSIKCQKKDTNFIVEISMDEVDYPQSPIELLFILRMLADQKIPINAIAPKFSGSFNIGVDYQGNIPSFKKEFEEDLIVLKYAVEKFGLPPDLKLSIHNGSNKSSLYPIINHLIKKHDAGLHIKTAGATWLEELIGIAQSGIDELNFVTDISIEALERLDELIAPYSTVVNINRAKLPSAKELKKWTADDYVYAINPYQKDSRYNPDFRQLLNTAYKLAAESRDIFIPALQKNAEFIGENVKANILNRHIIPLFS